MGMRTTKLVQHRNEVRAAYEAGGTMQEIAGLYDVSVGTVRNELINQGVEIRSRGRRKQTKTVNAAKPEFKVSALDENVVLTSTVTVEVAPDIPVETLPVEHSENVEGNEAVNDDLRVIFGESN